MTEVTEQDKTNPAYRLGFEPGQTVLEIGHDDDTEKQLRDGVAQRTGQAMLGEDQAEDTEADVVLLWFRDSDGDLADTLVDALGSLSDGGHIWLLTPKTGQEGYLEPSDVAEASVTAGLATTTTIGVTPRWSATRLVSPKAARSNRK
ncbi:DUF3052 domain-containing protein [Streptomyces sp. NPDC051366]|uniref:DUF3052 domain-containing protein n=1 Tax=Streptomyces sp. NPDC051366 TaxID=3365652 RepID=UPI003795FAD0